MKIPERGLSQEAIFEKLEQYRAQDLAWRSGRAWAYVYHAGRDAEEVAKRAYSMFLSENALDPTVYPSLLRFENEIVSFAARHLGGDEGVSGNFTSGGTESLLLAVKTARDWARKHRPEIRRPQMLAPVTAHAAFHKAAHYFDVELVPTPVDSVSFRADVEAMRAAITPDTILLVGSASGYAHGVVDPIRELGALALERGLLLHVDGCIGGFLLPYFRRLGAEVPDFGFEVPGVTSMSMDLHKYAFCPKGASVVLYRSRELRRHQIFACANWTGYTMVNTTVQSTKGGGPLAAAWAVLNFLGDAGYLELARVVLEATRRLVSGIDEIPGLRVLGRPEMSLIAFTSESKDLFALADEMRARGWYVQPQLSYGNSPRNLHLTVGPNNAPLVGEFLSDLRECAAKAPEAAGENPLAGMVLQAVAEAAPGEEPYAQILEMAGVEPGGVPQSMSEIHGILDGLPAEVRKGLLVEHVNKMFV